MSSGGPNPPYAQVKIESRDEWRRWLVEHHRSERGIWVMTWMKSSGHPHVPAVDIGEEALCFGWVDSRPRA